VEDEISIDIFKMKYLSIDISSSTMELWATHLYLPLSSLLILCRAKIFSSLASEILAPSLCHVTAAGGLPPSDLLLYIIVNRTDGLETR
jgi:hypothetical protein